MRTTSAATVLLLVPLLSLGACSAPADRDLEPFEQSERPVVDVPVSSVKQQTISNCWLYATAGWVESLHLSSTGREVDVSESYWMYWYLFEQIVGAGAGYTEPEPEGSFRIAAALIDSYGLVLEGDFVPEEDGMAASLRQKEAMQSIEGSLRQGALSTASARRDPWLVRSELNKAFGLGAGTVACLEATFGGGAPRKLTQGGTVGWGAPIYRASDVPVLARSPWSGGWTAITLADSLGVAGHGGARVGPYAWDEVAYPSDAASRRWFQRGVQRALHDRLPVIVGWFVDTNANEGGRFRAPPAHPGRQGGHLTVLQDYEVDVPGFGILPVGRVETRPEALRAALSDAARIVFFRTKNSWGTGSPGDGMPDGFADLYVRYLDGPIRKCEDESSECVPYVPWRGAVLPVHYLSAY